ncbi:MAG: integrin alpha [Xanthomonadales bacterium]|nr:integrin alpha [Xanthomonadales bacterium]
MIVLRKAKQKRLALAISMALAGGAVYANFPPQLELSDLNGTNGFVINGANTYEDSGTSVSSAGDINGDGINDLIIGAPYATNPADFSGSSYVVFGSDQNLPNPLNLSTLDGSNGFVINGSSDYEYSGTSVSAAGDINGDGIDDLIIGAPGAFPNGYYSGASYVVFGSDQPWAGSLDLSSLDGSNGFVINGVAEYDESGTSVSTAGDINGDGFDDLIIGAPFATVDYSYAGVSYVVFGSDQPWAGTLNLSAINGSNGFVINGVGQGDDLGASVSNAGDINNDGFDDVIIGAADADTNGTYAGASYVVFGSDQGFPNPLNLSGLDGSNGFVINGVSADDEAGTSVSTAGDINTDGIDDLIVGASLADPNGLISSGASYVVFGSGQPWASSLNLSALNGSNGFVINGVSAGDNSGASVSTAGDINGDGIDDLLTGAPLANANGIDSGASYVVFGSDQAWASSFDLSGLNGSNGFVINGVSAGDYSGTSLSTAGDINGDGFDDLITGAPFVGTSGASYVVYGAGQTQNDDVIFADSFE